MDFVLLSDRTGPARYSTAYVQLLLLSLWCVCAAVVCTVIGTHTHTDWQLIIVVLHVNAAWSRMCALYVWHKADLIHIGARFTPCMRDDLNVRKAISDARTAERNSACCVRNDGSGCLQTTDEQCSVRCYILLLLILMMMMMMMMMIVTITIIRIGNFVS